MKKKKDIQIANIMVSPMNKMILFFGLILVCFGILLITVCDHFVLMLLLFDLACIAWVPFLFITRAYRKKPFLLGLLFH